MSFKMNAPKLIRGRMGSLFKRDARKASIVVEPPLLHKEEEKAITLPEEDSSEDKDVKTLLDKLLHVEDPEEEIKLIDTFVDQQFRGMEVKDDTNLEKHLLAVQTDVQTKLLRLTPEMESGAAGHLLDRYHRQMFVHLRDLLRKSSSTPSLLLLLKWVLQTYLSRDLLQHPDLQKVDLAKRVDLMLMTEWTAEAKAKLIERVHVEVSESLERILQSDQEKSCNSIEAFTALPVDVIQRVNAIPATAGQVSSCLFDATIKVCFQELLVFVTKMSAAQTAFLGKQYEMTKDVTIEFMRTLKTCQEIKKYVQAKECSVNKSLLQEITAQLDDLDESTLKLLQDNITLLIKDHFKTYFNSNSQKFLLLEEFKRIFPKEGCCSEVQTRVMNETYKLTVELYLTHLIQRNKRQLKKSWNMDVGQEVKKDAKKLHQTMSDIAAGVRLFNIPLIHVSELLKSSSIDVIKMEVALMSKECGQEMREILPLIPKILKWAGFSASKIKEVLDACPES